METSVTTADGTVLHVDTVGAATDPAVLLMGGTSWSLDWWEDGFCAKLAAGARHVIRYDQRDTGQSTTWPSGQPGYSGDDLADDAAAILDALAVERAHLVGLSMGGGIAQVVALRHPERVSALTLMATTSLATRDGLPGPTSALLATWEDPVPAPDWRDADAAVAYIVELLRPYAAAYDEERVRTIAQRVVARSHDLEATFTNHPLARASTTPVRLEPLAALPALVVHGAQDPMFPPAHGEALAAALGGAPLLVVDDMGHELPPPAAWDRVVEAILATG